ncbi:hypothetical protein, partial [Klebsiella pneumoniae]|uniref:hypothetical protein n=1 Tax=Klebsiella pneumoniae TaxID=573 RepID=UPI0039C499E0
NLYCKHPHITDNLIKSNIPTLKSSLNDTHIIESYTKKNTTQSKSQKTKKLQKKKNKITILNNIYKRKENT